MKLLAASAAFVGGTLFAFEFGGGVPLAALALFAVAGLLCALLLTNLGRSPWIALIVLAAVLGAVRVVAEGDAPLTSYASSVPQQVEGLVVSDVEALGNFARFRLDLKRIRTGEGEWTSAEGLLLVSARANAEIARQREAPYFQYGDRLHLEGHISTPPLLDGFDYAAYLARQGISEVQDAYKVTLIGEREGSTFYRSLYSIRRQLAASIAAVVPEPQAALAQGMLLGLRRNIPAELTEAFRLTGTAHLLAISGLHVGILLIISLNGAAALLGRKHHLHLIAPLVIVWVYGFLSGMSPSATRACIMGSVYLMSLAFGRQRGSLAAIGCAAALMVAVSPAIIFSVSFQLSFAAIAGIAAFSDMFGGAARTAIERGTRWNSALSSFFNAVADMLAASLAATITTLPLIGFHFERVSTLGIPASVLTLPALPPLIVGSAGTAMVGLWNTTAAMPLGWLVWLASSYLTVVITLMAKLPGVSVDIGNIPVWAIVAYYCALVLAYGSKALSVEKIRGLLRRHARGNRRGYESSPRAAPRAEGGFRARGIVMWLLVPAVFAVSLAWSQTLVRDDRLRVVFFDVGQGDAVFIETPGGKQVVVDGGADPRPMMRLLGERMQFNDRKLDIVAATHPHSDHVGGLAEVLKRYEVSAVLERRIEEYESAPYEEWARAVNAEEELGAIALEASAGMIIALDGGARIEVLGPPRTLLSGTESDADNASLVLRLIYGDVSVLLTGDIFADAERALLASGSVLDSDVLKVPHHGSDSSSTSEFISAVSPSVAVISVGADNRFGHPNEDVVERLQEFVAEDGLLQTAEHGTVEVLTDGKALWVHTER